MFAVVKSEFTKIFTQRSTYVVLGGMMLLSVIIGSIFGDIEGLSAQSLNVSYAVTNAVSFSTAVLGIVASLIILNEYRHNTIAYSIVSSRNRYSLFGAKVITALVYGFLIFILIAAVALISSAITVNVSEAGTLSGQNFDLARSVLSLGLMVSGHVLLGLFLGFILRNIILVIVAIFAVPLVEGFMGFIIDEKSQYLPYASVGNLTNIGTPDLNVTAAWFALMYIIVFAAVSLFLFVKRDA